MVWNLFSVPYWEVTLYLKVSKKRTIFEKTVNVKNSKMAERNWKHTKFHDEFVLVMFIQAITVITIFGNVRLSLIC